MSPLLRSFRLLKKSVVIALGIAVLALGVALIFLPGPAIVVIPIGLAILGAEFAWARNWLKEIRARISARGAAKRATQSEQHRERHMGQ